MRLTLVPESTAAHSHRARTLKYVEGADETEIFEKWRTDTGSSGFGWGIYDPENFRQRLVDWSGADVDMPAEDDAILPAVVAALGPDVVQLERAGGTALRLPGESVGLRLRSAA
jgi:hypothetical protein